jgi:formyl-CoA transferase
VAEVIESFLREGIPAAPVQTYAQAARDPHVLARDILQHTAHEDGTIVPITGPAAKFSRTPTKVRNAARALGADTEQILASIGVDATERQRLNEAGVI